MRQFRFVPARIAAGLVASLALAHAAAAEPSGAPRDQGLSQRPVGRLTAMRADNLQRLCASPQTLRVCDGYISGVSDGITLVEAAAGPDVARKVCLPAVSGAQLRSAVVGWMSRHPDRLSSQIGPVVYQALEETFPCAGAGSQP